MFLYRETVSQGFSNGMAGLYTAVQYCSMAGLYTAVQYCSMAGLYTAVQYYGMTGLYTAVQAVEQGEANRNSDVHFPT